jgi:radical SAM protein with 4Fe4S-binding SPASM domain
MEPVIVSNLTGTTSEHIDTMHRIGVSSVGTSLDGPPEIHDRIRRTEDSSFSPYANTTAAMRELKSHGFFVSTITHVNRWNIDVLDDVFAILEELDVDLWQIQIGFPQGRLREVAVDYLIAPGQITDLCAFLIRAKGKGTLRIDAADNIGYFGPDELAIREHCGKIRFWAGCLAGYRVLAIRADGTVQGCPSLDIPVGNILERSLVDIWNDEKLFWFNACWDESKLQGRCRACPYRRLCRGGCKSLALSTTGSIYRNIYCLNQLNHLGGDPNRREDHGELLS